MLRDGRSVGGAPVRELTTDKVIAMMVGREVGTLYPRPPHKPGVPLLKVENWTVEDPLVPGRQVLRNVSLEVREREIVGIGGPHGRGPHGPGQLALRGGAQPRHGHALAAAAVRRASRSASPPEAIAAGLALVSEDRKRYGLVLDASVSENLTLASLRRFVRGFLVDDRKREAQAREEAEALNIRAPGLGAAVRQLSGGNQQKVVLGKWLLTKPRSCSSTSPRAAWTWGPRRRSTASSPSWRRRGWAWSSCPPTCPELLGMSHRVLC